MQSSNEPLAADILESQMMAKQYDAYCFKV